MEIGAREECEEFFYLIPYGVPMRLCTNKNSWMY